MMRIAVLEDYQNVALKMADWSNLDVTVFNEPLDNPAQTLNEFQIICIMHERTLFSREMFQQLPLLKLLISSGKPNAGIDLDAAKAHGAMVCGIPSLNHATAELTWGLILALARRIPSEFENIQEGRWQMELGCDIRAKTLGIVGLDRMGAQVADIGKAFGMNVIAWNPKINNEKAAEGGIHKVEKEVLFKQADIISIHMEYASNIKHLVGKEEFLLMKKSAFLINTSHASVVDTDALIEALQNKKIAGAGLEVHDIELLPKDHQLRSAPNCFLTPHLGYVTKEGYDMYYQETVDIIRAYLNGEMFLSI